MTTFNSTVLPTMLALISIAGSSCDRAKHDVASPASPMQTPVATPPAMPAATPATASATGTVVETMDAANYTYVRIKTSSGEIWAATGQFKIAVGDKVSVPLVMPMENFHSNTLNRTFPTIYFASRIERQSESGTK